MDKLDLQNVTIIDKTHVHVFKNPQLTIEVDEAIKLLRLASRISQEPVEVSYSGGKDSDVILKLVQMAEIPYRAIYKNTTIDPPGTIAHCLSKGVEIVQPKKTFLELVRLKGMPTRRARFCCSVMKEYKILDTAVQGIRRVESVKRAARYHPNDVTMCRYYGSKKEHVNLILPILNWTDEDVEQFITELGLVCHPIYYRPDGSFDVTRRLGCIGCPLKSDQGVADYMQYPLMLKQVANALCIWWETHPNTKSHKQFPTPYDLIAHNLLFRTYEKYYNQTFTLFGTVDWKQQLQEKFNVQF